MKLRKTMMFGVIAMMTFLAVLEASAGARQRPLSDWLDAQGSVVNPVTCNSPTVLGFADPNFTYFGFADYSGKINACITAHGGPVFNAEFSGSVTERDLPDGTAEVTVIEHFTNTYAYALDGAPPFGPVLGYRQSALLGQPDHPVGTANGMIQVKFLIPYPGAPLPDLIDAFLLSIKARIQGEGPLRASFGVPEGTPGKFIVSQTGLFNISGHGNGVLDGFPGEIVNVFQSGN
ncbi:MAG TPA: hypothetical protein VNB22_23760 [Pyrinomonadaceae bacterium]|nr:hypothetical protein [Pyrinomonadaceae bacterium]